MEIWANIFQRCSRILYCVPKVASIGGPTILGRVYCVVAPH